MLIGLDSFNTRVDIKEAKRGKTYYCPICKKPLIQKKGEIKAYHFAHSFIKGGGGNLNPCLDHWTYDMTEWHMSWQRKFDPSCIEKVVKVNGKMHKADILVGNIVVEFQHSPISIEDFRERNDFYTASGYKVIWLFDLIDIFENQKIRLDDDKEFCYHRSNVKKLFKDINVKEEKASIYFQFSDDEDEEVLGIEGVRNAYNEFGLFYTDRNRVYSKSEFIKEIKTNSYFLFPKVYKETPKEIPGGSTILELWKENYTGVKVKNLLTNDVMIINGKNGSIYRTEGGYIKGKYCYLDNKTGYYKAKDKYYIVSGADKKIWELLYQFIDKDYEQRKKLIKQQFEKETEEEKKIKINEQIFEELMKEQKKKEKEYIESFPQEIDGCVSLEDIMKNFNASSIIVKNMFNGKSYKLNLTDNFFHLCNAYEIINESGDVSCDLSNMELSNLKLNKIWKRLQ